MVERLQARVGVVRCLECMFLHQPNPVEDQYLCLRTLREVRHELDEPIECRGFKLVPYVWVPTFVGKTKSYA